MKLSLILCAIGLHRWCLYCCRSSTADRNTQRECDRCSLIQRRDTQHDKWTAA